MCGVAGFASKEPIPLKDFRVVLDEIGTRGIHSTGMSWFNEVVQHRILQKPYYEFDIPSDLANSAIFHTRYSTSNVEYPQPVYNNNKSIAHNGVITQTDFENWQYEYGYLGHNKCDTSLMLQTEIHPLAEFPDASMAAIELTANVIEFYRNEQRPLYYIERPGLVVVASTKRALEYFGVPRMCEPCVSYTFDGENLMREQIREPQTDLQLYGK